MAFSPNGKTLAGVDDLGDTARLWDVATHRPIGTPLRGGPIGGVYAVAFSPDGKILVGGGEGKAVYGVHGSTGVVRLWSVGTHRPIGAPLTLHSGAIYSVAFSPNGKTLATGGDDGELRLWDGVTRSRISATLRGHTGAVYSVAFSPDGKTLASGSTDQTVRFWDVATHRQRGVALVGSGAGVESVAFSRDGKTLASGSGDGTVRLWDVATRRLIGAPLTGHTDAVSRVAFSPDGANLASSSDDGTVRIWSVPELTHPASFLCRTIGKTMTRSLWTTCPKRPQLPPRLSIDGRRWFLLHLAEREMVKRS